jgi:DNA-directed RNA polymerase specialized sigma24 family protein
LWFLLAKITRDKSHDLIRRSPKERGESALGSGSDPGQKTPGPDAWQDLKFGLPFDPSTMIELTETKTLGKFMGRLDLHTRDLLDKLDDGLRQVALLKLQRFTLKEIATKLGCVPSTVLLKIKRIKKIWLKEGET